MINLLMRYGDYQCVWTMDMFKDFHLKKKRELCLCSGEIKVLVWMSEICFEEIVTHVLKHFGERKMCVNMFEDFFLYELIRKEGRYIMLKNSF